METSVGIEPTAFQGITLDALSLSYEALMGTDRIERSLSTFAAVRRHTAPP